MTSLVPTLLLSSCATDFVDLPDLTHDAPAAPALVLQRPGRPQVEPVGPLLQPGGAAHGLHVGDPRRLEPPPVLGRLLPAVGDQLRLDRQRLLPALPQHLELSQLVDELLLLLVARPPGPASSARTARSCARPPQGPPYPSRARAARWPLRTSSRAACLASSQRRRACSGGSRANSPPQALGRYRRAQN
jgi:hypothetical protein